MKKLVLAVLLLVGTTAYADTLSFTGATANGVNGPYSLSLNGGPATPMICFSDANYITNGETWTVQAYTIKTIGTLTGAFAGSQTEYNELGYLATELFAKPGDASLQNAIWYVLGTGGAANADYTAAVKYVTSNPGYMTSDVFYIPTGNFSTDQYPYGVPQPFISTPEPSSLVLLVAGFLGLIGLSLKKITA